MMTQDRVLARRVYACIFCDKVRDVSQSELYEHMKECHPDQIKTERSR